MTGVHCEVFPIVFSFLVRAHENFAMSSRLATFGGLFLQRSMSASTPSATKVGTFDPNQSSCSAGQGALSRLSGF